VRGRRERESAEQHDSCSRRPCTHTARLRRAAGRWPQIRGRGHRSQRQAVALNPRNPRNPRI